MRNLNHHVLQIRSTKHTYTTKDRVTRLVEQELVTHPVHLSAPPIISWDRVTRSLVVYVCFVDRI
jgi:hypothetical protein